MSGELPPGTRLIELHIARELNTSQGPVREALCELEGLELVVTEPYKGTRVREVTPQDIREAYMVRAMLEDLAGQLAAPYFKGSVATLEKTASAILDAAHRKDVTAYARHDVNFHRLIVEGASNRILLRTWNSLAFEVRLQMWLRRSNINLTTAQEAHWKIIEALEQGDGKRAGELLQKHIFNFPANPSFLLTHIGKMPQTD
ncbi:GntR family transcriptional regulator [Granulicella sp. 5B5]|uniref:GntR family transcriptional regulator n=1 Tax=Granulicella sp. 5B5 TaxID=1617967 RepID=UPI0015F399A4|nr:GntR family transcriptional regulator [Granulicella sp. 5B5]